MTNTLEEMVDPRQAALLVVDVQNDFIHEDGGMARAGNPVAQHQKMVKEHLLPFLAEARSVELPIIFIQNTRNPWTAQRFAQEWGRRSRANYETEEVSEEMAATPLCLEGSWGGDFYKVKPLEGDCVVRKYRYSAFVGTNLDLILRNHGIDTLILTGVATNVCVESTARDASMLDYRVIFVSDCTSSRGEAQHQGTLLNVHKHFGTVVPSGEIIVEAWQKLKAKVPARQGPAGP